MNNNFNLLNEMHLDCSSIVVNQCSFDDITHFEYLNNRVTWINSSDRGLSKSRNVAISNSDSEFCLLADDDLVYVESFYDKIIKQFDYFDDASILVFIVDGIEREFKKYGKTSKRLNYLSILKVSSVQIAFRRSAIIDNHIKFNDKFGSGSIFSMGEENIFLSDCLKNGLKAYFVPVKIADLHMLESSWFKGFNRKYCFDQGASLTAFSKKFSLILILSFALRKRKLFKLNYSLLTVLKYMLLGRKKYLMIQ
jgi:glycosyltransferase involved in cell wall biosynthesis